MKQCATCQQCKPLAAYHVNSVSGNPIRHCKACMQEYNQAYYAAHRERWRGYKLAKKRRKLEAAYERMVS